MPPPPPDFLTAVKREPLEKWPGKKQRWDQLATINHRGEAFPQHCVSSLASSGVGSPCGSQAWREANNSGTTFDW